MRTAARMTRTLLPGTSAMHQDAPYVRRSDTNAKPKNCVEVCARRRDHRTDASVGPDVHVADTLVVEQEQRARRELREARVIVGPSGAARRRGRAQPSGVAVGLRIDRHRREAIVARRHRHAALLPLESRRRCAAPAPVKPMPSRRKNAMPAVIVAPRTGPTARRRRRRARPRRRKAHPMPLPRNDGSTNSSLRNHSSSNACANPIATGVPSSRATHAPRGAPRRRLDVQLPARLIGPAPRRHVAHVVLRSRRRSAVRSFDGSASSSARPRVRGGSAAFFSRSGNLAERLADRRIIERSDRSRSRFSPRSSGAISPRTSPSTTISRPSGRISAITQTKRAPRPPSGVRCEPRASSSRAAAATASPRRHTPPNRRPARRPAHRVRCPSHRPGPQHRDPRFTQLRTQRARFEQRVVDVAFVPFVRIAIRRRTFANRAASRASIVAISSRDLPCRSSSRRKDSRDAI